MSLDMLESVHLLSAMFVELPNLATRVESKRRIVSKAFRRLFDHHLRQSFNGPPENTRDLVMAATKSLRTGEWQKCVKYVNRLRMWDLMPNAEHVRTQIKQKIQEDGLKTYLLTYASQYISLSLETLMDMFQLSERAVYRVTSKMSVDEQLQGAWHQPTASIIMHGQELTHLQKAALKFTEKVNIFYEQNERLVGDQRTYYNKGDKKWDYNMNISNESQGDRNDRDKDRDRGRGRRRAPGGVASAASAVTAAALFGINSAQLAEKSTLASYNYMNPREEPEEDD